MSPFLFIHVNVYIECLLRTQNADGNNYTQTPFVYNWRITMRDYISNIAFTDTVKKIQKQKGSRGSYANMEQRGG